MIRVQCWLRTWEREAGVSCYTHTLIDTHNKYTHKNAGDIQNEKDEKKEMRGFIQKSERRELENNSEADDRLIPP